MLQIKHRETGEVLETIQADTLSGQDLREMELSGADLGNADLSNTRLEFTDLTGANLKGANLENAVLAGAHLNHANLQQANLSGAKLGADSHSGAAILLDVDLTGAKLTRADLRYRGFSSMTRDRLGFERFRYADPNPFGSWNPPQGWFTRYGDVTPLLERVDDMCW